ESPCAASSLGFYQDSRSHILLGLACPNGGTGRRAGLKIRSPKTWCGFDSLFGHQTLFSWITLEFLQSLRRTRRIQDPRGGSFAEIGRASCGKECRSRWPPYD